eukprot:gb/GFBE01021778.1/.p1 GENE.gb/GFBE01021778.1/~~gb/GFBE01021778.1/.p1  ORF type:complete len:334 (+),score=86.73 gb/GFBE01021778.1/:1-1002(+)
MARLLTAGFLLAALPCRGQDVTGSHLPGGIPVVPIRGINGQVDLPMVGLGTWQYNSSVTEKAIVSAFALGYRHIDTAFVYENQLGVGKALRKMNIERDEFFVTSKIPGGLNASATVATADQCLKDLGLKSVDLMLIHFPADFGAKGSKKERQTEWKALEAWAKSGKARALGVSHYCQRHIEDVLEVATVPIAVNQVQYHVGMGSASHLATDDRDFMRKKGILYQSFSPLCGPCNPPDNKELISGKLVTEIGKAHNKTGSQVALRWLVQQGIPVIPKSDVAAHQKTNSDLFDFKLTRKEMARLTAATSPAVGGGPSATDSGDCGIDEAPEVMVV